ncbi:MAG TPA: hypothetical protein VKZ43_01730 [Trueperaceae bacterium]|nr:hypothetical protein [Trueperaceae bacterium]
MKRSLQEYVELVVFGLIALLVGTGLLWVLGWVLSLGGIVLKGLAGLLWMLLRFIVPVAIAGGLVYFLVKAAQDRQRPAPAGAGAGSSPGTTGSGAQAASVIDVAPAASAAGSQSTAPVSSDPVAPDVAAEVPSSQQADETPYVVDDAAGVVIDTTAEGGEAPEDESPA